MSSRSARAGRDRDRSSRRPAPSAPFTGLRRIGFLAIAVGGAAALLLLVVTASTALRLFAALAGDARPRGENRLRTDRPGADDPIRPTSRAVGRVDRRQEEVRR